MNFLKSQADVFDKSLGLVSCRCAVQDCARLVWFNTKIKFKCEKNAKPLNKKKINRI